MNNYHQLSSEKYYRAAVETEMKVLRKIQNKEAFESFKLFLFTLVVGVGVVAALYAMPSWLPIVTAFLQEHGVLADPGVIQQG